MADIFGGQATPPWITLQEMGDNAARDTAQIGHNFAQALSQKRAQDFQNDQLNQKEDFQQGLIDQQRSYQQSQQTALLNKLSPVATALANTSSPQESWDVVSKNPQWLIDPQTQPVVSKFLQTQSAVAKAQSMTVAGKITLQANSQFNKDLEAIDPSDASNILSMKSNPNGSPTPMQLQALALAKQSSQVVKQNTAAAAGIDASLRGDDQKTVINGKGDVTQTYTSPKPVKPDASNVEPKVLQIDADNKFVYFPGAKTGHMINSKTGTAKDLTPFELKAIAKDLPANDPVKQNITSFLTNSANMQIKGVQNQSQIPSSSDPLGLLK